MWRRVKRWWRKLREQTWVKNTSSSSWCDYHSQTRSCYFTDDGSFLSVENSKLDGLVCSKSWRRKSLSLDFINERIRKSPKDFKVSDGRCKLSWRGCSHKLLFSTIIKWDDDDGRQRVGFPPSLYANRESEWLERGWRDEIDRWESHFSVLLQLKRLYFQIPLASFHSLSSKRSERPLIPFSIAVWRRLKGLEKKSVDSVSLFTFSLATSIAKLTAHNVERMWRLVGERLRAWRDGEMESEAFVEKPRAHSPLPPLFSLSLDSFPLIRLLLPYFFASLLPKILMVVLMSGTTKKGERRKFMLAKCSGWEVFPFLFFPLLYHTSILVSGTQVNRTSDNIPLRFLG